MPRQPRIPFVDLAFQHRPLQKKIWATLQRMIARSAFIGGESVETFERRFAEYCGCRYAVGCSSGTAALHVACLALGLTKDHEVITTPFTFTATAAAILHAGARPVFVDIDPQSHNLDPRLIQKAITSRTKAILAVHLYGLPCDLGALQKLAKKHNLYLIEDCAQAHGASIQGKKVGSFGDVGCFSFYPSKNLGAMGDAGALVTKNPRVARIARSWVNHGRLDHFQHDRPGFNYRLDSLQAAILNLKLTSLPAWIRERRRLAKIYIQHLGEIDGLTVPPWTQDPAHAFHLFVIQSPDRDRLRGSLEAENIQCGVHYPRPLHLQPAYRFLGYRRGDFPVAEKLAQSVLSLPLYNGLQVKTLHRVAEAVRRNHETAIRAKSAV